MTLEVLIFLLLLQIKHWLADFYFQTLDQVNHKGIYGNYTGITHSLDHTIGMGICLLIMIILFDLSIAPWLLLTLMLADGVIHYHIDWAKMNWGNRDIKTPQFWNHLGLDQALHHITYIVIAWILL